jgi:hypothetical protein
MKLETNELAKQILLGKVNCRLCQNHIKCEFDDNTWWCSMSKKEPSQTCEQWEPPNISALSWDAETYNVGRNLRRLVKIRELRKEIEDGRR